MVRSWISVAAVALAALAGSQAPAATWQCSLPEGKLDGRDVKQTVEHVCTGLGNSWDFWISGHAGHLHPRERPEGLVKQKRMFCVDTDLPARQQIPAVVGAVEGAQLELFCVDPSLRGGGESVRALNAVLEAAKVNTAQVKWISSDDENTQRFYKSLDVGCACDEEGPVGKGSGVRYMEFTAASREQPIKKKEQHFTRPDDLNFVRRILFDACMSSDDFNDLSAKLIAGEVAILHDALDGADQDHPVPITRLVSDGRVPGVDKRRWLKDHPVHCR